MFWWNTAENWRRIITYTEFATIIIQGVQKVLGWWKFEKYRSYKKNGNYKSCRKFSWLQNCVFEIDFYLQGHFKVKMTFSKGDLYFSSSKWREVVQSVTTRLLSILGGLFSQMLTIFTSNCLTMSLAIMKCRYSLENHILINHSDFVSYSLWKINKVCWFRSL